ncbi:hypothetical protein BDZ89DRAFT_958425, partial [Hymenopellis radicata]
MTVFKLEFDSQKSKKNIRKNNIEKTSLRAPTHDADGTLRNYIYKPSQDGTIFPPDPLTKKNIEDIVRGVCTELDPAAFQEAGCAICGQLVPIKNLSKLSAVKNLLSVLEVVGVTRKERFSEKDPITDISGPVIDSDCKNICNTCRISIRNNEIPVNALAQSLWLGKVPEQLSSLNWIEQIVVARVRHNACFIKINSGYRKLVAHCVAFANPTPKMYDILPPPREEIEEAIVMFYTGPKKPDAEHFRKLPLVVRPSVVRNALNWLRLNHSEYMDLGPPSEENLKTYPTDMPPISLHYKEGVADTNITIDPSVHENKDDQGIDIEENECAFIIHGLVGNQLDTM